MKHPPLYAWKRWMYRGDRPDIVARVLNALSAKQFSAGVLAPRRAMTLLVRGRSSGRTIRVPVVVADVAGERYLVSMLGENANWVRNVRAAGGDAMIERRGREAIRLAEVPVELRAPILRRYLALAPGARPHLPVDRHAPLVSFVAVAARFPVFRIVAKEGSEVPRHE